MSATTTHKAEGGTFARANSLYLLSLGLSLVALGLDPLYEQQLLNDWSYGILSMYLLYGALSVMVPGVSPMRLLRMPPSVTERASSKGVQAPVAEDDAGTDPGDATGLQAGAFEQPPAGLHATEPESIQPAVEEPESSADASAESVTDAPAPTLANGLVYADDPVSQSRLLRDSLLDRRTAGIYQATGAVISLLGLLVAIGCTLLYYSLWREQPSQLVRGLGVGAAIMVPCQFVAWSFFWLAGRLRLDSSRDKHRVVDLRTGYANLRVALAENSPARDTLLLKMSKRETQLARMQELHELGDKRSSVSFVKDLVAGMKTILSAGHGRAVETADRVQTGREAPRGQGR